MAVSVVQINTVGDYLMEEGPQFNTSLNIRRDGVIVYTYSYLIVNDVYVSNSYSLDLGLTWTQNTSYNVQYDQINSIYVALLSTYYQHYISSTTHHRSLSCQAPESLTAPGDVPTGIIVDDENIIHIFYAEFVGTQTLFHIYWNGVAWSTPEVVKDSLSTGKGIVHGLCFDNNGNFHVCFDDSTNLIYYTNNIGGTWLTSVLIVSPGSGNIGKVSGIFRDSNNDIHIVYVIYRNQKSELYYRLKTGASSFSNVLIDATLDSLVEHVKPIFYVDADDIFYVVYGNNSSSDTSIYNIKYFKSSNYASTWDSPVSVTSSSATTYTLYNLFYPGSNYPAYNTIGGLAGVFRQESDNTLFYFYTDDVSYPFSPTSNSKYCRGDSGINFYSNPNGQPVNFYSRPDTQPVNFYSIP